MVDKEIVLETIKKMYDSGIEDSVVEQTLRDIGLSREEISKYIAEAKGKPVQGPEPKPKKPRPAFREEREKQEALHTTTHVALEEQAEKTSKLVEKIDGLEKKLALAPQGKALPSEAAINQRLASIEKQLRTIKAELGATKAIMEKILETDRKVLNRL